MERAAASPRTESGAVTNPPAGPGPSTPADGGCGSDPETSEVTAALRALREEQRRLNLVQRVARMGSWEYNCGTGETVWSPNLYELLGLSPGSVEPRIEALRGLVSDTEIDRLRHNLRICIRSGEPFEMEFHLTHPDGEVRTLRAAAEVGVTEVDGTTVDGTGESGVPRTITGYARDITDAEEAAAELDAERGRLLEAQRIATIGSWSFDAATGKVHRSEVLLDMYAANGVRPDDDVLCNVHHEDRPAAERIRSRLTSGGTDGPLELELRGELGGRIYVTRSRAERGADGTLLRMHGTLQDVTEQRALERQLEQGRRRLDDAQRAARLGTWEWDPETDECVWSEMLHELAGSDPAVAVTFTGFLRSVHTDDRRWLDEHLRRSISDGTPVDCEFRAVRPDRAIRIFRCRGGSRVGDDGHKIMIGTAQDVTEQRATETRMRRSSQRFADLVAVAPVGIGLFDESERLVDANNSLCELLGYEMEQLRGSTSEELTHPEQRAERARTAARITGALGSSHRVPERLLLRADGRTVCCELHITASVRDDGRKFWLVVFADITEQRRIADVLRHQATHDELTGLPNRAAVKDLLASLLRTRDPTGDRATGEQPPSVDGVPVDGVPVDGSRNAIDGTTAAAVLKVAVLFCDIDNFKRVNDSLGHDAGDELLVALARRLEDGLPAGCTAARISGDEFVIICADVDAVDGVEALARTVSGLLRNAVPVGGQLVKVSASIGAALPSTTAASGADLLRFADAAMFEAKRRGAGRVSVANDTLIASANVQVQLEGQLREALATDQLTLHYQPVVAADGSMRSAEALIRWQHPERGMLAPDVFLPVAEQGDLLRELDKWVLRTALRQAAGWPVPDAGPIGVAVNLSALVPGDPGFVDAVADAVAESGIAWDRLVLELVETRLVDLPSRSRAAMSSLTERGVRFAVDDFGTGYSSLARLKDLPAQIIKVDRRFVSGVGNDPSDFAVARAVVDMARAMGRSCVAEGVETATQFNVLRGVGVDAYQGWLFSRAVPPEEFRSLLSRTTLLPPSGS